MLKTDFFLSQMELDNKENLESSGSSKMEVGQSSDSKTEPSEGLVDSGSSEKVDFKVVYNKKKYDKITNNTGDNGLDWPVNKTFLPATSSWGEYFLLYILAEDHEDSEKRFNRMDTNNDNLLNWEGKTRFQHSL